MKKIINDPHDVVPEMVNGMTRSYPQYIEKIEGTEAVVRADKASMKDRVGIISGGGSGHEPTHAGFVGDGMLSAAVCGLHLRQIKYMQPLKPLIGVRAFSWLSKIIQAMS